MTNRYSPYYDRDEERTIMSIDNNGSWVHITTHDALAARLAEAERQLYALWGNTDTAQDLAKAKYDAAKFLGIADSTTDDDDWWTCSRCGTVNESVHEHCGWPGCVGLQPDNE